MDVTKLTQKRRRKPPLAGSFPRGSEEKKTEQSVSVARLLLTGLIFLGLLKMYASMRHPLRMHVF